MSRIQNHPISEMFKQRAVIHFEHNPWHKLLHCSQTLEATNEKCIGDKIWKPSLFLLLRTLNLVSFLALTIGKWNVSRIEFWV